MAGKAGGRPGLTVPRIALGCGNFGGVGSATEFFGQGLTEDQAFGLMDAAYQAGIDWFDTADAYGGGRSERAIGRWMASRGVRPRLTTKTFNPMQAGADHGLKPDRIARQLRSSLDRLGVDRVELYLAHEYDPDVPLAESFGAFGAAQADGLIGAYGVSNFDAAALAAALAAGTPQAVQNSYSLLARQDERDVLPLCAARGVAYLAFGPLAGGWLTGKYRRGAAQASVFPTDFDTPILILIYAGLILGGAGSIAGAATGALVVMVIYDGVLRSPAEASVPVLRADLADPAGQAAPVAAAGRGPGRDGRTRLGGARHRGGRLGERRGGRAAVGRLDRRARCATG